MSSRALRRLRVEQEASLAVDQDDDDVDSSSEEEEQTGGGGGGFMAMGMLDEESSSEEEESSSSSESEDEDEETEDHQPAVTAAAPSTKSKKGQAASKKQQDHVEVEEEDLDAILSDLKLQNQTTDAENNDPSASTSSIVLRSILLSPTHGYDTQDLDLDYALRDLLGGAAVAGNPLIIDDDDIQQQQLLQQQNRRGRNRGGGRNNNRRTVAKKYLFGKVKPEWGKPPSFVGGGLGVKELLTQDDVSQEENGNSDGKKWSVPWPYTIGYSYQLCTYDLRRFVIVQSNSTHSASATKDLLLDFFWRRVDCVQYLLKGACHGLLRDFLVKPRASLANCRHFRT